MWGEGEPPQCWHAQHTLKRHAHPTHTSSTPLTAAREGTRGTASVVQGGHLVRAVCSQLEERGGVRGGGGGGWGGGGRMAEVDGPVVQLTSLRPWRDDETGWRTARHGKCQTRYGSHAHPIPSPSTLRHGAQDESNRI